MSENTNQNASPEQQVRNFTFSITPAGVIPIPIDPTLSNQGEAADAYATGQAIVAALNGLEVNGKTPVNKKIVILAADIKMSDAEGAQTIAEAIAAAADKTAADIMYDTSEQKTVETVLNEITDSLETDLTEEEIDEIWDEVFTEEDDD